MTERISQDSLTEKDLYILNVVLEKKKKHKGKGYRTSNSLRLSMEITMTDESVLRWVHEVLGVGTLNKKPRKGRRVDGTKYLMQYRWRCTFRDAYYVCCMIWPWSHTKLEKVQQVIQHYAEKKLEKGADIINIDEYKMRKEIINDV